MARGVEHIGMGKINERSIAVFAEQQEGEIHRVSYELLGKARELSGKIAARVTAILLGPEGIKAQELIYRGADRVYYLADEAFAGPNEFLYKENLIAMIRDAQPEIVLMGATPFGRSIAPRISAALHTGLTADCTGLEIDEEQRLLQIRPAFSENILAQIKTRTLPQMATIRYKEFPEAERDSKRKGEIEKRPALVTGSEGLIEILEKAAENEVNIEEAEVVVAGGNGLKNPEGFRMIEEVAEKLGGVVGASRSVVDQGYISKEHQVGYSGKRVKPKFYIACGISGSPQHLAGMKESGIVIAINTDPSAPIFRIADYGIVGDLYEVLPRLADTL